MPTVRSTSGVLTRAKSKAAAEPVSSDEAMNTATTSSASQTTEGKQSTEFTCTEKEVTPAPAIVQTPPAPPPSRSIRTSSSTRARRLAHAQQEALKIKLELAQARIAAIEAEQSEEEDDATVLSNSQTEQRVNEWLTSAIDYAPQNEEETEPEPPQQSLPVLPVRKMQIAENAVPVDAAAVRVGPGAPLPAAATAALVGDTARPSTAALPAIATLDAPAALAAAAPAAPPPPVQNPSPERSALPPLPGQLGNTFQNNSAIMTNQQNVNISELASAIAIAARAGHRETSRYNVDLPHYSGSHHEWLSFKAAFTESAATYSGMDNIARLRRSLKGRAKEAVENLLIYNANADEIMKTLESRFGRPDSIALAELERLRALPRLTDGPRDICVFASRVANATATLRALNRAQYLFSPETTKAMLEKLTPSQRYRWFDYAATHQTEEPEIQKLSTFLQREAEYCAPYAQPENIEFSGQQQSRRAHKAFATTEKYISKCACCSGVGHYIEKCPKFIDEDIQNRWKMAKSQRLCFRCLRYKSRTHNCKRVKCEQDGCEYFHHKLLHYKRPEERNEAVTSTWTPKATRAYLKIVPIEVSGPAGVVHTYALLDDGSTITLVNEDIATEVGLDGPIEPLQIEAITDEKIDASRSRRVKLNLRGSSQQHEIHARTIDHLRLSPQTIKMEDLRDCAHLIDIEDQLKYDSAKPQVLIGQDNWHLLIGDEVRRGQRNQPVATLTPLGWVLHGAHTRIIGHQIRSVNYMACEEKEDLNEQLGKYFAIESLMIEPKRPQSDPEQRALVKLAQSTTTTPDGHYQTPLLWKEETSRLPDNYENTLKRLQNIEKKLDKDDKLKKRYNEEMEALLSKGYAEPAPSNKGRRVWYLPHFAVLNPMKPDKVRIVHDAAAKTRGVSLNCRLLTGPDQLQSLPGVLMRFRQHPVAVGADIREMFMQVKVHPDDRDALRYLWRGDRRDNAPPEEYRMTSLIFGATCSPSIAIYVKNTNALRYEATHPDAAQSIVRNHYVDDYLQSFETEDKAIRVASDVRHIHSQARYELRQWTSNSPKVLEAFATEPASQKQVDLNKSEMKNERVLGQVWKPSTDELAFNLDLTRLPPGALSNKEPTKRQMLKIMMSVWDPLGLASPVTIQAKKVLQEAWRRGAGWDCKQDDDLTHQWVEWTKHLQALRDLVIPRCYPHYSEAVTRELHIFVDASETAYTSALYWRVLRSDGQAHVSLITAKAKVAPLKITSVPRLELQAAVMGSRMATTVVEEHDHKPDTKTFWTDSRTVLAWLRAGARTYRPFVAHRIAAIEENSTVSEWRWVPTRLNVADEATRDVPHDFGCHHRWFMGPEFLYGDPTTWPQEPTQPHNENTGEERVNATTEKNKRGPEACMPPPERFSRWERLLRTVGRVLQFIDLCRPIRVKTYYKRTKKNKEVDPDWSKRRVNPSPIETPRKIQEKRKHKVLDAAHLKRAENLIVRVSQSQSFTDELRDLRHDKPPAVHSRLRYLAVELVNGVITLKTRIGAAEDVAELQKKPPVLDGNHPAVKLYIDFIHRQLNHIGVEATINECKQQYCILRLRPVARMIVHRCLPCRIRRAKPSVPPTGDHPRSRLAHHQRPFTYTGLDYYGPITVTVGRSTQKRYVALFTCLTTRAVHLEVAASLSGDSAVMALRRMIARRGCPTEIWSDNGSNFHAAYKELRRAFDESMEEEAAKRLISWRFLPAAAPFMAGAWERMVRACKEALRAVLEERRPNEETLVTLLAEAEYTVNSRPLTHVLVDVLEPETLTPNHFLLGGSARVPTPGTFDDTALIGRASWRAIQRLADHFWSRWLREYLPTLQDRREPYGRGPPINIDDVVLIADGTLPRNTWPRGRVIATYPGPDGVTRVVDVKTKGKVLRRPTKKLIILPTKPAHLQTEETLRPSEHSERSAAGEMCRTAEQVQ